MIELPTNLRRLAPAGLFLAFRLRLSFPACEFNLLPQKWIEHYTRNVFVVDDPLIRWAHFNKGVVRWSEVNQPDPKNMIVEARKFGMSHGAVASMLCPITRCLSYVLTARDDRPYTDEELASIQASLAAMHEEAPSANVLTPNEIAALRMIREGLKVKVVSHELGISESAVKQRLSNIRRKFGADTTMHAVMLAEESGIL